MWHHCFTSYQHSVKLFLSWDDVLCDDDSMFGCNMVDYLRTLGWLNCNKWASENDPLCRHTVYLPISKLPSTRVISKVSSSFMNLHFVKTNSISWWKWILLSHAPEENNVESAYWQEYGEVIGWLSVVDDFILDTFEYWFFYEYPFIPCGCSSMWDTLSLLEYMS